MQVVVDANIIHRAFEYDMDCQTVLLEVRNNILHGLAIDNDLKIGKEYRRQVTKDALKAFEKWWKELWEKQKVQMYAGKLTENNKKLLIQSGFHEHEDHVYVAVALQTDKYIVTEDGDYEKAKAVMVELNITFEGAEAACYTLRDQKLKVTTHHKKYGEKLTTVGGNKTSRR